MELLKDCFTAFCGLSSKIIPTKQISPPFAQKNKLPRIAIIFKPFLNFRMT